MSETYEKYAKHLSEQLEGIRCDGLYKNEAPISSPQSAHVDVVDTKDVLNMCANNYLGLADNEEVRQAARDGLDKYGFGMASVRFICGTLDIHKELEQKVSSFLGTQETILYSSCFDANAGLFETLLGPEDAIISDELNHASIIDGVRLCKAKRFRYKNSDMGDLEAKLIEAQDCRFRMIATDGVFSMDGYIANLPAICDLADKYDAMVMVDDSHATGFMGSTGRGTAQFHECADCIDVYTSTLGKALGGASGGFTSGRKEIIDFLRQRSRPYLFSNSLAPHIVTASMKVLEMLESSTALRDKLMDNTQYYRSALKQVGMNILEGTHPIVPVMIGDASLSQKVAKRMFELGVYVVGFFYPVVPQGKARIRTQVSAAHSREDIDFVVECFAKVKKEFDL